MNNWKLPVHLEPYREYLWQYAYSNDALKYQADLLQRLYDDNLLKEPPPKISIEEAQKYFGENTIITEE